MAYKLGIVGFFRQVSAEIKKVFWPSRREVLVSVAVVMIIVLISSLFFFAIDQLIGWIMQTILGVGD
ncbi:preprotein translocase subunit SecE [Candidatus Liberibacter sp.]|uniref:preprotein translocase subunit SecE n=1 Tax=Candidatus Liberibacter sp. TaxID=34022 RepID=UPI0015F4D2BC|nr:preprotein translocase subunit SecE [Candidatus Liberibacter sp.]MBA5724631.1 preprotein translocase subunit SecE [Candidatus Liberibacter sp.]